MKMRIAFVTPNIPGFSGVGGIGTYVQNASAGLASLGHEVHTIATGWNGAPLAGLEKTHLVSSRHLPVLDRFVPGAGASLKLFFAVRRLVRELQLDLIEFPNWEGFGCLFTRFPTAPAVVRLHTSSLESQAIDGQAPTRNLRWDVRRERWLCRSSSGLVTHSRAHREAMSLELGVPEERIHLIPHGVKTFPGFTRTYPNSKEPTVVYLGRLEKRKGTIDLLKAIPQVIESIPNARFVLIGQDREHAPGGRSHRQYIGDEFPASIRERITLTGPLPQPEVDQWLQKADVFVAPSLYESFGLVFLEAMRWGTPVIGTTAGGIPEVVEKDVSGLLVRPEQPLEIAEAIITLLKSPELRARLGKAGKYRVEHTFSLSVMAKAMSDWYEHIAKKTRS